MLYTKLKKISGVLLFLSLILSILFEFNLFYSLLPSGILSFLAASILFFKLKTKQKKFILSLLFISIIIYIISYNISDKIDIFKAFIANQFLLTLLLGVHFLRLITISKNKEKTELPRGKKAFFKTYLGLHLFGAVINLSALLLVADNLYKKAKLTKEQLITLIRAFASDAFWSPFFVAFAAAMTYAHDSKIEYIFISGISLALIAFIFTYLQLKKSLTYSLNNFVGFPISTDTIWLPMALLFLVSITHYVFEDIKVIALIAFYCLVITIITLAFTHNFNFAAKKIIKHSKEKLPSIYGELTLFFAAGVFGSAVSTLLFLLQINLPFENFDGIIASILLLIIVLLSYIGIHPIISISILGNLFQNMEVNHTLMAIMFLCSWGISVATSPFSGMNLTIQARYEVSIKTLFKINYLYGIVMYIFSSVVLIIFSKFLSL